jgi:hypothetical protein
MMTRLDEQGSIKHAVKAHPRMALAQTSRAREVAVHATARACRCRVKQQCAELLAPHSGQCVIPALGAGGPCSSVIGMQHDVCAAAAIACSCVQCICRWIPPQYMLRRALASPRVGARITRVRFSTKSNYLSHFHQARGRSTCGPRGPLTDGVRLGPELGVGKGLRIPRRA